MLRSFLRWRSIASVARATPRVKGFAIQRMQLQQFAEQPKTTVKHQKYSKPKAKIDLSSGPASKYEVVIGLEVHAQILSHSKLFSPASTAFGGAPNSHVSIIDAAMPGTLPIINSYCVEQAIKTGLALEGSINNYSQFDRKHYFYPDLPQGYQITQQFNPLVTGGQLAVDLPNGDVRTVRIQRVQIEQDSGKSLHDQDPHLTLVDLNRVGVGLMEIISHPDIRSSREAGEYIKKLQFLLQHIGTCDGNMAEGSMRCDINVSVKLRDSNQLGTRCEIKNVSSVYAIVKSIEYEAHRQIEMIENGETIEQETRLWDGSKTVLMRSKENIPDYRFFPDPDLPPLIVSDSMVESIRQSLPELPDALLNRFMNTYGLSKYDASVLLFSGAASFFEEVIASGRNPKRAANWVASELFGLLNKENMTIAQSPVNPSQIGSIIDMIEAGQISGKIGKDVIELMFAGDTRNAQEIVQERGWIQMSDTAEIERLCNEVLARTTDEIERYKAGQKNVFGFLVGQVIKATKGKANPKLVADILKAKIDNSS